MPRVRMPDGQFVEVGAADLFQDDGTTPFVTTPSISQQATTGRVFTEEDVARIRQEEKDKLYGQIQRNNEELASLRDQVGSLTAAEQRREAQLEEENRRLEAERKRKEEEELDARSLIERKEQEFQSLLEQTNQTWEQRFHEIEEQRRAAEAQAAKEQEFGRLRDYTLARVKENEDRIAPQFVPWISGNSQEEIDAAIARAIQSTDEITAQMQEALGGQVPGQQVAFPGQPAPQPPVTPGTRATGGPGNTDPAAGFSQQLTAEQIANMPMDQYAKLRGNLGIGGQSNNRGLFG